MTQNMFSNFPLRSASKHAFYVVVLMLIANLQTIAAPKETATFIPVGFLPGDDFSYVNAVNDSGTLAACVSYHRDPNTLQRVYTSAARWTPTEGMQPLPLLADTPNAQTNPFNLSIGGKDVTNDGSRIVYTSHTTAGNFLAVGIADFDGSNVLDITALPNGDKLTTATQLSDDGATAFGYRPGGVSGFAPIGAVWTAGGGVSALLPPAGFAETYPAPGAVSADGSVSAGILANTNADGVYLDEQAYRWTAVSGVQPLGYLPGGNRSAAFAISSDGTKILGSSSTGVDPDGPTSTLFFWTTTGGMTELSSPQISFDSDLSGGEGLSADGELLLISGFVRRLDYPFYFPLDDLLVQAGAGDAIAGWSRFSFNGISGDGNTVWGQATNPDGKAEGFIARFPANYFRTLVAPLPEITSTLPGEATLGESFNSLVTANGMPDSFEATGLPAGLELIQTSYLGLNAGLIQGTPTEIGEFHVTLSATNVAGTGSADFILKVMDSPTVPKLLNISTRAQILTNDKVLIGGFVISGPQIKKVLLRGIGPSLAAVGITDPIADPTIELHQEDGTTLSNDDWKDSQQAEIEATNLQPSDDHESALIATLAPGSYTLIVSGKNGDTGVGLVDIYDLDETVKAKLSNISTRGFVDTDDKVLIGGVIVGSVGGDVVVRAIGPSLEPLGVADPLLDPVLEIHNADGSTLASNDDWRETQEADIEASGFAPDDDRESVIIATLPPAGYTAIVHGKGESTGVALVEAYNIDQTPALP